MGEEKAMVVRIGAVAGGLDGSALLLHLLQLLLHTTHSLSPLRIQLITIQILLQTTHPRLSSHLISFHSIPFHSVPFHPISLISNFFLHPTAVASLFFVFNSFFEPIC